MKHTAFLGVLVLGALAACNQVAAPAAGTPEEAGLVSVRPFPAADDVCMVIGENALTVDYLDDSATLVGCPQVEAGAIADREAEGGMRVGAVGDWVLLSVPN